MIFDKLNHNPIARMELIYQQRDHAKRQKMRQRLVLSLLSLFAIICFGASLTTFTTGIRLHDTWVRTVALFLYPTTLGLHFVYILRTLHVSSAAVIRQKQDTEHWNALVLTGISAREFVLGKWWATTRMMWGKYAFLAFLRASVASSMVSIGYGWWIYIYWGAINTNLLAILLGNLIIVFLTLINLPYTAACGVLVAMIIKRRGGVFPEFAVRTAITLFTALIFPLSWLLIQGFWPRSNPILNSFGSFAEVMLDNGLTLSIRVIVNDFELISTLILFTTTVATYATLTWLMLRIAQWRAERFGALKSHETKGKAQ